MVPALRKMHVQRCFQPSPLDDLPSPRTRDPGRETIIEFQQCPLPACEWRFTAARRELCGAKKGETLVLLGRSGAGKTTALKLINRLIDPSEGDR